MNAEGGLEHIWGPLLRLGSLGKMKMQLGAKLRKAESLSMGCWLGGNGHVDPSDETYDGHAARNYWAWGWIQREFLG